MALVNNEHALNTVYNHFLTSYAPKSTSKYDAHKKSELRSVYNSIVKQNKESPLYLIDTSRETQEFAVGMKENARELKNTISSLSSQDSGNVLDKKAASSTNPELVQAKYIGESSNGKDDISFDIGVSHLATTQINYGSYLPDETVSLKPDTYSFDIHINDTDYEFQFNINENDTNKGIQTKLSNLLNRSNIGVTSSVVETNDGRSSLRLESVATGLNDNQDAIFVVSDNKTSKSSGAVEYFGLNELSRPASNAVFTLNGIERNAYSNSFTVDKQFEITLNGVTGEDNDVSIGLKPDVESMTDNISQLIDGYNDFVHKSAAYSGTNVRTDTLLSEVNRLSSAYRNDLDAMGLRFEEDNTISIDHDLLTSTLEEEDAGQHFNTIRNFTSALVRKSNQIALNPMNYVQKTVVAYKNPGKSFANPYITSMYSGMMFNSYC